MQNCQLVHCFTSSITETFLSNWHSQNCWLNPENLTSLNQTKTVKKKKKSQSMTVSINRLQSGEAEKLQAIKMGFRSFHWNKSMTRSLSIILVRCQDMYFTYISSKKMPSHTHHTTACICGWDTHQLTRTFYIVEASQQIFKITVSDCASLSYHENWVIVT